MFWTRLTQMLLRVFLQRDWRCSIRKKLWGFGIFRGGEQSHPCQATPPGQSRHPQPQARPHKPGHVSQACFPLLCPQSSQTLIPSIIEFADWHCSSPFMVCGNHNLPEECANQLSFVKLFGKS